MNSTLEPSVESTSPLTHADALFALQLSIARRADELCRRLPRSAAAQRGAWLRAEQEILERVERAKPHALQRPPAAAPIVTET